MTREEATSHIEFSIRAYQNLIDNDERSGEVIGENIKGEWKSEKTLVDFYKTMIGSLKMAIKALKQEPKTISLSVYEQVRWKRDVAIEQLKELGYGLGEKPKTERCKDCKHWKDSDGVYRRGVHAESECPMNTKVVFDGDGYCYLFSEMSKVEQ